MSSKFSNVFSNIRWGRKSLKPTRSSSLGTCACVLSPMSAKCSLKDSGHLLLISMSLKTPGLRLEANLMVFQIPFRSFLTLLALRSLTMFACLQDLETLVLSFSDRPGSRYNPVPG